MKIFPRTTFFFKSQKLFSYSFLDKIFQFPISWKQKFQFIRIIDENFHQLYWIGTIPIGPQKLRILRRKKSLYRATHDIWHLSRHVNQYHLLFDDNVESRLDVEGEGRGGEGERASFDEDSPIKDNKRQPRLDTQRTNRLILTSWRTWGGHPTLLRSLPSWIMAASLSRGNWRSSSSRGEDSRAETIFIRMQISSSFFILYIQYLYKYNANLNTELIGK